MNLSRRTAVKAIAATAVTPTSLLLDGCNGTAIAQDICNWTPALQSTAATVASTVALLVPPDAPLIAAALVGFDAATNLAVAEAKAYLANPGQTALQALQTGIITLQQQVNAALLTAVKVVDPKSQQLVTAALNAVATVINSIFALILQIKGNTVAQVSTAKTISLVRVAPLLDREKAEMIIAAHYDITLNKAAENLTFGQLAIVQAGF
jgi:hypothetical protein